MTMKLTPFEVEDIVDVACERDGCTAATPCPAHRLLAHIKAQDQELTDLRAGRRVLRGEMENYRKAYWAYEPRPRKDP